MKLSREQHQQARAFIFEHGRPLERALYGYHFEHAPPEVVYQQLELFQNADGGFGNALEPDLRAVGSSALATTVGLQILRALDAPADHALVRGAIGYLLQSYDRELQRWPIITAEAATAPHAPWWEFDAGLAERFGEFLANPRAEIVGYLYQYSELVPQELLETLGQAVEAHLSQLPDKMEMHDLQCYVRLAETAELPDELRARSMQLLERKVAATVERDPAAWEGYGLPPLAIVTTLQSPFAALFGPELDANLDQLLASRRDDGSWTPAWSWAEQYPDAWPEAQRDWSGVLTLGNLRTLQSFGRLE